MSTIPHPEYSNPSTFARFLENCSFGTSRHAEIQYAQFRGTPDEDRYAHDEWELGGHVWQFLAVFDGHGGPITSEYLAKNFPSHIRRSMERDFSVSKQRKEQHCDENLYTEKAISDFLKRQVREFDAALGNAVKDICSKPAQMDDKDAQALYRAHKEVIARARCGSTMAGILVDKTENKMWVCCVGDSSVVLSYRETINGKRKNVLLNTHHTGQMPLEYHRVSLEHPSHERENIWLNGEERIFGTLGMTRSFGDFMYKLHSSFTAKLFSRVPSTAMKSVERVLKYSRSPPYVIVDPFVRFVDLAGLVSIDENPSVMIYTDGLEALAYTLSTLLAKAANGLPRSPRASTVAPTTVEVVGAFVGQPLLPSAMTAGLDHSAASPARNEAFALMYNLFCHAIPEKLTAHLIAVGKNKDRAANVILEDLYIDDVTLLVFRPFKTNT